MPGESKSIDSHPPGHGRQPPRADAIVALGAAFRRDGQPSPALVRRARHAVALYEAGAAPLLLFSGGPCGGDGRRSEAEAMAAIARGAGVPEAAILLEPRARNTRENAVLSAEILRPRGGQRVLLVTDAFHMRRARLVFRAQGLCVVPAPVPEGPRRLLPWLREGAALLRDAPWALRRQINRSER